MKIELAKSEIIHFIGIGGIGMSGLALIMHNMGFTIQGTDVSNNKNIERLKKNKIKITIGHKKSNIKNATIVVISSAIKNSNPEVKQAERKKLPIFKRGDMLGHITSLSKNITVVGSHGKTTTTSLISSIFSKTNLDPTVINGGVLNSFGNSAKLGKSKWSILELDESDGSFIKVLPTYSIITNIDREHMDYYKSMNKLFEQFEKFIEKVPSFGKLIICIDDSNNKKLIKKINFKNFFTFGVSVNANFQITNIIYKKNSSSFDILVKLPNKKIFSIKNIRIPLLGLHNIKNATAAIAVTLIIGISTKTIKTGLRQFKGVQRRFNKIFTHKNVEFYDDYAHHPSEIKEVLSGIKKAYKKEKIVCVFQPHRISRLKDLRKEFSKSFKNADEVLLCPLYTAGEKMKLGFKYEDFARQISNNSNVDLFLIKDQANLARYVKSNVYGKKLVIGMGAGSISAWMRNLPNLI
tara:strand:+ start:786 stop:2180 length:1395 start_codon:yes stop_codon:yes gene_type:complete